MISKCRIVVVCAFFSVHAGLADASTVSGFVSTNCVGAASASEGVPNQEDPFRIGVRSESEALCGSRASALAGKGYIGVLASASGSNGGDGTANARATTIVDDIWITTPVGFTGEVRLRLGLSFDVFMRAVTDYNSFTDSGASVSTRMFLGLSGFSSTANGSFDTVIRWGGSDSEGDMISGSFFDVVNTTLWTGYISASPLAPLRVVFNQDASAFSSPGAGNTTEAVYDSLSTLSFRKDGPVFDLPEGFTVNSASGNIVDNRWIDPRTPTEPPSAVPLPAGMPLLLASLTGLIGLRRFRLGS